MTRQPRVLMEANALLAKLVASKVSNGYQVEIVTTGGDSHWGFITGADESMVQLYTTGVGENGTDGYNHGPNSVDIRGTGRGFVWVPLSSIEVIHESRLGLRHLTIESRELVESHQSGIKRAIAEYNREKKEAPKRGS